MNQRTVGYPSTSWASCLYNFSIAICHLFCLTSTSVIIRSYNLLFSWPNSPLTCMLVAMYENEKCPPVSHISSPWTTSQLREFRYDIMLQVILSATSRPILCVVFEVLNKTECQPMKLHPFFALPQAVFRTCGSRSMIIPLRSFQWSYTPCTKKVSCSMFDTYFCKCWPIFKILSPGDS